MDRYLDFTYDTNKYDSLPDMVSDLHAHNQSYVMILDPGISDVVPNDALTLGNQLKVWITTEDGQTPLEGKVWPGKSKLNMSVPHSECERSADINTEAKPCFANTCELLKKTK